MFKIGQKVRFVDAEARKEIPAFCPYVGSVGVVLDVDDVEDMALVDWDANSGVWQRGDGGCSWWCMNRMLEVVVDE